MARNGQDLSLDRRTLLKTMGAAALLGAVPGRWRGGGAGRGSDVSVTFAGMPGDGAGPAAHLPRRPRHTRRSGHATHETNRRRSCAHGGPRMPGTDADVRGRIGPFQGRRSHVVQHDDLRVRRRIWGRPGADAQIEEVIASIRAAGKAGPAGHRVQLLRQPADGGLQGGDRPGRRRLYRVRLRGCRRACRPRTASARTCARNSLKRAEHFLKAIVPEAEKANVRLALHPNDPPVPLQPRVPTDHGDGRALEGVSRPGQESVQRHDLRLRRHTGDGRRSDRRVPVLGERDCINHVHFRNVVVRTPYVDYTEVFLDDGQVDMFGVMKRARAAEVPRDDLPRTPARDRRRPCARPDARGSIREAAVSRARSTTSDTRERCSRPR